LTLILIGVLAAACGGISITVGTSGTGFGAGQAEDVDQTYREPITRLVLDSDSGTVDLSAGPDGAVNVKQRLQWDGAKPQVTVAVDGDTLRVTARCPPEDNRCEVNFTITLPAATAVDATTGAGAVRAAQLSGDQRLVTSAGGVTAADMRAKTVDARTTAGIVELSFAQAPQSVTAESTAGSVEVTVPRDGTRYRVEAGTTAGQRTVDVATDSTSQHVISAQSTAGSVTVRYAG
jgi:hypothetical protein